MRSAFSLMNLPVYNRTIFFKLHYLSEYCANFKQKSVTVMPTKIPRDDGLLSDPTTEVSGNDP